MNDGGKTKLEILKMARELLNEEYINRRAQDHNKWLSECDAVWKNQGVKLPYPAFAPYPSEAEILARAQALYSFVAVQEPAKEPVVDVAVPETISTVTQSTNPPAPVVLQPESTPTAPIAPLAIDPIPDLPRSAELPQPKPLFATKPMPPVDPAASSALKNLLPSWLQARENNV